MSENDNKRTKLIHNERVKLLATAVNSVALAFIIGGVVAPTLTGQLGLLSVAWFVLGIGLHLAAQYVLGRMQG